MCDRRQEKENTSSSSVKESAAMRAELTRAQADVERMSAELETKNAKLAESEQLLNSNNQVRGAPCATRRAGPTDACVCSSSPLGSCLVRAWI